LSAAVLLNHCLFQFQFQDFEITVQPKENFHILNSLYDSGNVLHATLSETHTHKKINLWITITPPYLESTILKPRNRDRIYYSSSTNLRSNHIKDIKTPTGIYGIPTNKSFYLNRQITFSCTTPVALISGGGRKTTATEQNRYNIPCIYSVFQSLCVPREILMMTSQIFYVIFVLFFRFPPFSSKPAASYRVAFALEKFAYLKVPSRINTF
jgi:hypothetical protein